jgi:hypothetical protein
MLTTGWTVPQLLDAMNVVALYIAPKHVKMLDDVSLQCQPEKKKKLKKKNLKKKLRSNVKKYIFFIGRSHVKNIKYSSFFNHVIEEF